MKRGVMLFALLLLAAPIWCYEHLPPAFLKACEEGDLSTVKRFVEGGLEVKQHYLEAPIVSAAGKGRLEVIKYLVEKGARIDDYTGEGTTAIYAAVKNKHTSVTEWLLDHGADASWRGYNGYSLLHLAVFNNDFDTVRVLVRKGHEVNATMTKGAKGGTPLEDAIFSNRNDIAYYLLSNGANPSILNDFHSNTVTTAVFGNNLVMLRELIARHVPIEIKDTYGQTALWEASMKGSYQATVMLLDAGASPSTQDNEGVSPLEIAIKNRHFDVARLLLDRGADVEAKDNEGQSALHYAAATEHTEVMGMLIDEGADIEIREKNGNTPLHIAVRFGTIQGVEYLIKRGADINAQTLRRMTALYMACVLRKADVVRALLKAGARFDPKSDDLLLNPYLIAKKNGDDAVMKEFESFLRTRT